ncbi:MAG: ankyrin repeat domain-containing protein [Opitutales bacterium]|nr:ankyrin repeat domain-containing protein [Opitutales bacterium]
MDVIIMYQTRPTLLLFAILGVALLFPTRASEIHESVISGDFDRVRELIESDEGLLQSLDHLEQTPLHLACSNAHWEIVDYLIHKGANVDARTEYGVSVLSYAIRDSADCLDTLRLLVEKGAEINVEHSAIGSPLHAAVNRGNLEAVEFLIQQGADIEVQGRYGSPLQMNIIFIENENDEMAKHLVKLGASASEYSYGMNAMHLAALKDKWELIQIMIDHHWEVDVKDDYGHTPLFYAARHGNRNAYDTLIAAGADDVLIAEPFAAPSSQLTQTLELGEAFIWYLGPIHSPGTGYVVKTQNQLLIFDPQKYDASPNKGLQNGFLNSNELNGQKITFFFTHTAYDADLVSHFPGAEVVFWDEPLVKKPDTVAMGSFHSVNGERRIAVGNLKIHSIPSSGRHNITKTYGVGYLVEVDGLKIFHAGLHSARRQEQVEEYRAGIDLLKSHQPIDIAILPVRGRHLPLAYENYRYLIEELSPGAIYLIGDDRVREEHRRCLSILHDCGVPIFYPDGGVAVGQRFFYER